MKYKKTIILIGGVILLFFLFKKDLWEKNEDMLRENVLKIGQSVETVELTEVTPFEWDTVYSFSPYTPKNEIYETVGYKWDRIQETVNEGMNQIVFLQDGKVVCYVYGYPTNNRYGIYYSGDVTSGGATVLNSSEDLKFQVKREDDVVYLIKE
ncbi:hypothetical protein RGU12_20385 [Fredinandcohnia sp. QZ13]|uniref:hypothetical protein n=1 Tax=Fredinandcohnia sp. QZ13 TaxID=3073144 RepID=UPI0028531527|nr:hypothetical protein [Fredinandcohnia sp. QZ13]MDR4889856.1 hypothetical protein [Fredinandcohnia sp. QZ13]